MFIEDEKQQRRLLRGQRYSIYHQSELGDILRITLMTKIKGLRLP